MSENNVLVIGGGLAGLSCAVDLVDADTEVTVVEKNDYLGGRASNTFDSVEHDPTPIAPHIYVSFYDELKDFFGKIGAEDAIYWEDGQICEAYYDGELKTVKTGHLSPPWYLAYTFFHYPFLSMRERLSNFRFAAKLYLMSDEDVEELDDKTVEEFLDENNVAPGVKNKFYKLVCLALLNAPIERCSAAEFTLLMRNFMKADATDWGYPKGGLGDVYTGHARDYIEQNGGEVKYPETIEDIVFRQDEVSHVVTSEGEEIQADVIVSALPPTALKELMPEEVLETEFFSHLKEFHGVSYYANFAWFDEKITDKRFWALIDSGEDEYWNTDFYDKSNIPGIDEENSYITSNIINTNEMAEKSKEELKQKTLEEIREVIPDEGADLEHFAVHEIDYALYEPVTGMREHKRSHETPINNFYLSGDWTIKEIPQCMEAAVRSGRRTAEKVIDNHIA